MLLRCLIRSRETMHLGKTHRFKKIASDAWHVGAGSAIIDGVCCGSKSEVESHSRRVSSTPMNGHHQTGPAGPFRAPDADLCFTPMASQP
jgi:hypothetical protein